MRHYLLAGLLAVVLAFPAPGFARAGKGKFEKGLVKELNLTEAQKQQLQEMRKSRKGTHKEKRKAIREAHRELETMLQKPTKGAAYRETLLKKFNEVQQLRAEVARAQFEKILDIREILDEEQIKKFKGIHGKFRHGRGRINNLDAD